MKVSDPQTAVEATREAEDRWVEHIGEPASRWLIPNANTWYTGTDIAGKPRTFPIYVAGLGRHTDLCNDRVQFVAMLLSTAFENEGTLSDLDNLKLRCFEWNVPFIEAERANGLDF